MLEEKTCQFCGRAYLPSQGCVCGKPVKTMYTLLLNPGEIQFICNIINAYGTGQHPCAEATNLHEFGEEYVLEIIGSCLKTKHFNDKGVSLLTLIKTKLEG